MATDYFPERSPEARRVAETALAWLLHELDDQELMLIVVGGLVPQVLTRDQDPPAPEHLGTTDVDLYLAVQLDVDGDLAALETAMKELGFHPDPKQKGWRWVAEVEGWKVKIEFLCELDDRPAETALLPPGCKELTALNLRGTGFVADDWEWEELTAAMPGGDEVTLQARFAGLEGYLMSKVHVAQERGLDKDYYDLVYTLLYNRLGGPREVAAKLATGAFASRINLTASAWRELAARFQGPNDVGPRGYASEAMRADPTGDDSQFRQDAVGAVHEFLEGLAQSL